MFALKASHAWLNVPRRDRALVGRLAGAQVAPSLSTTGAASRPSRRTWRTCSKEVSHLRAADRRAIEAAVRARPGACSGLAGSDLFG